MSIVCPDSYLNAPASSNVYLWAGLGLTLALKGRCALHNNQLSILTVSSSLRQRVQKAVKQIREPHLSLV